METWKEGSTAPARELEPEKWVPQMNRRDFVTLGAGAAAVTGFALAAGPVHAQTLIQTDSNGLTAGDVMIDTPNRQIPGYRAVPTGEGPWPIILVVEEIFGVHEHIKDMCRRIAKNGYLAVAPELYARLPDAKEIPTLPMEKIQDLLKIVNAAPDTQTVADLDSTVAWAAKNGGDQDRVGITGWCRGGRTTWLYSIKAGIKPKYKAAVSWYGTLKTPPPSEAMPKTILEMVGEVKWPVLGLYGGKDTGIPMADVEEMKAALRQKEKGGWIVVYPDAPHGFNADYRPSYRKEASEDGLRRMYAWFKTQGVFKGMV
jgi:carboxymethylenebutenolidase